MKLAWRGLDGQKWADMLMQQLWSQLKPGKRSLHGLRCLMAFAGLFTCIGAWTLSAATFTATLDRDSVTVGDSAVLTLKFEGGQPKFAPEVPQLPNLQIASQGNSQNFTMDNGVTSSSYTLTYALTPTQPGDYLIPPIRASLDGKIVSSQPLKLKAVKMQTSEENVGDRLALLKLFVPKTEVYVGEIVNVQLQLLIREGVANGDAYLSEFERISTSQPLIKVEGCNILKTGHAQRQRVQLGNGIFNVATIVTAVSPVKTGPITIDSINTTLTLQLPSANQRRDAFDPFGMFQHYDEKRVAVAAEPKTVTALSVPKQNAPANYNGAVGNYALTVTAGPTNVAVGDPITVRVQITGSGALDSLALPDQPAWRDFKTYPPTAKVETTDPLGIQGTKTFEQVIVPQSTEIRELPPISFSYFDSEKKRFSTLTQPAIGLSVRPGGSSAVPVVAATSRPAQETPAQDIVSIKQRPGKLEPVGPPLVEQPWFVALQSVPALTFIGCVVWRKQNDSLANNPRLRRQRKVAQIIRDGLNELRQFAAEKNSDEFFATLFRLLQEQLGERLDLPASAITEAVIEEHLKPRGVPETTLSGLHELFQTCNLARYAPVRDSQELEAMIPKLETVLDELQKVKA